MSGHETDIVLVGGGHAHVHVLTALARQTGLRVTLVSEHAQALYSGMLPGAIAGLYEPEQAQIDLVRLTGATGARLVLARATGIDRHLRNVHCPDGTTIRYDLLSLDVGSTPALDVIPGARDHGIAVKPIGAFLGKLAQLRAECARPDGPRRIAVVGGGAGGVELLLSLRTRLRADAARGGRDPNAFMFTLITDDDILPTHNHAVRAAFRRTFRDRGMILIEHRQVARLEPNIVALAGGQRIDADAILLATQAAAPAWLGTTGLALDAHGFVAVGPTLQSLNDARVFAAGDCAALTETPREKSGVFAVRAGPPLAGNLRSVARGEQPRSWRPQKRQLALISTGERYAVASWGPLKLEGAWLWRLKDWIDRRWVDRYRKAGGPSA